MGKETATKLSFVNPAFQDKNASEHLKFTNPIEKMTSSLLDGDGDAKTDGGGADATRSCLTRFFSKMCSCCRCCSGTATALIPTTYLGGGLTFLVSKEHTHADAQGNTVSEFFGTKMQFVQLVQQVIRDSFSSLVGPDARGYSLQNLANVMLATHMLGRFVETDYVLCARGLRDQNGSTLATSGWMGFALKHCAGEAAIIVDVGTGQIKIFEWNGERGKQLKIVDTVTQFYQLLESGDVAGAFESIDMQFDDLPSGLPIKAFATERGRKSFPAGFTYKGTVDHPFEFVVVDGSHEAEFERIAAQNAVQAAVNLDHHDEVDVVATASYGHGSLQGFLPGEEEESFHFSIGIGSVIEALLGAKECVVVDKTAVEKKGWTVRFESRADYDNVTTQVGLYINSVFDGRLAPEN